MKLLLAFVFINTLVLPSTFAAKTTRASYGDELKLNLENISAKLGVDIWMTRDDGKTWVMIGRTFKDDKTYVYRTKKKGRHGFHYHKRSQKNDNFRPDDKTEIHEDIILNKLEEVNEDILYSNNSLLSIQYEVKDVKVDGFKFRSWLYYTMDSGQSWTLYGEDTDGVSPTNFKAEIDGLYGFKVVSVDAAGLKEDPPTINTKPDVMVRIDTQGPKVTLLSPQPYDLWEAGTQRAIQWKAEDSSLDHSKCVSLYYSIGDPKNWVNLHQDMPSLGSVIWKIPVSENGKIFLRVIATDKAGNETNYITPQPFLTRNILEDLLSAKVRNQANMYYETATICRTNRDYPKAIKYYRLCLQLNPYHVRAHNDVAVTLLSLNEPTQAFKHYETGLKYSPSNKGLLINLAKLYLEHSQYKLAEKVLLRLVHLYPKSPKGLWLTAEHAMSTGNMERAREFWKRITDIDYDFHDAVGVRMAQEAKKWLNRTSSMELEEPQKGMIFNLGLK